MADAEASETRGLADSEKARKADEIKRVETAAFVASLKGKPITSLIGNGGRPVFVRQSAAANTNDPETQAAPESAPAGQPGDEAGMFGKAVGGDF
jgi:ribosomal protein L12E/L44/L45/RPP1/RPP2